MRLTDIQVSRYEQYLNVLKENEASQIEWVNKAASQGDLAENSEFDTARLELAKTRLRIEKVNNILADYIIIPAPKDKNLITIGSLVCLKIENTGIPALEAGEVFEIVEATDIVVPNSSARELSVTSLVGRKLLNRVFDSQNPSNNILCYSDYDSVERRLDILSVCNGESAFKDMKVFMKHLREGADMNADITV